MTEAVVSIAGAGLAGSEAAWQLARRGIAVRLYEMKRKQPTAAQHLPYFAELVCSNSLRSCKLSTGAGLLKRELSAAHSLLMEEALAHRLPAGNALAVDREAFSRAISERLREEPRIEIVEEELRDLDELPEGYQIIATGPLTSNALSQSIAASLGAQSLYFFDAAAPLVEDDSIDHSVLFRQSRYDQSESGDYLNIPLNREEYKAFYQALCSAGKAEVAGFDRAHLFSGCQPVEAIAEEGEDTLRFGPLKPVGLRDPRSGQEPYAVVQLRQDNAAADLWNMVGFQTRLRWPEQERVFRLLPGMSQARFARFGVMHRNTFICAPAVLGEDYRDKEHPWRFYAGQISGVEGYLESAASGLVAALAVAAELGAEVDLEPFHQRYTMMGGLARYVISADPAHFQPMKANFSLLEALAPEEIREMRQSFGLRGRGRQVRRLLYGIRALRHSGLEEATIAALLQAEVQEGRNDEH